MMNWREPTHKELIEQSKRLYEFEFWLEDQETCDWIVPKTNHLGKRVCELRESSDFVAEYFAEQKCKKQIIDKAKAVDMNTDNWVNETFGTCLDMYISYMCKHNYDMGILVGERRNQNGN